MGRRSKVDHPHRDKPLAIHLTTIQVESELKSELFSIAAELQEKLGRRVTLNEAIRFLIESHRHGDVASRWSCLSSVAWVPCEGPEFVEGIEDGGEETT